MEIIVHDTLSALTGVLERPAPQRAEALRDVLAPLYAHVPVPGDPVDLHHQGGGFRIDGAVDRYNLAIKKMVDADVLGQIESALHKARQALPDINGPHRLQVMLMLGEPDDDYLMRTAGGYYGMGGMPGWLYLLAWPSDEVIGRIAHCAVHEFHHQMRYSNVEWNPMTVTVGEHIVAEGLAEAFVRELSGVDAMGPWSRMVTGAAFDEAYAKITADIGLTGMQNTPAYVLGDTAARKFGGQPRGIADMAGYGVGLRIVDAHLAASGMSAAASTILPSAQILRNAGITADA